MRRFDYLRGFLPVAGGVALMFAAACGSDDNGNGVEPDAAQPEADAANGNGEIDAGGEPETTRASTVAIRDVTVTNPDAEDNNRGANLTIDFLDIVNTQFGEQTGGGPIGACSVTAYGATDRVYEDEGPVTITGTNVGDENGSFTCVYDEDVSVYRCILAEGSELDIVIEREAGSGNDDDQIFARLIDTDLSDYNVVGGRLEVRGAGDDAIDTAAFPIIGQEYDDGDDETILELRAVDFPVDEFDGDPIASVEDGSFRVTYGVGDGHFAGNEEPFYRDGIEDGDATISVSKPDGAVVEGFDVQADPIGRGMVLAEGDKDGVPYIQPHAFPLPEEGEDSVEGDFLMGCGESLGDGNGNCGEVPDNTAGPLNAFIIDGRTTDAPLEGVDPHSIPDPVNEWAIFTCAFLGGQEGTLDEEAINAILATNPTRIRMRAMHVNGWLLSNDDGTNDVNLLVGHELVGYTDVPQDEGDNGGDE